MLLFSNLQLLLCESADRPIEIDRNTRSNKVKVTISMFRESDGKNLFNKTFEFIVKDISLVTCNIGNVIVQEGTCYRICTNLADENGDTGAYLCKTHRGFDGGNHASIDGQMQPYSYCINVLGKRILN